MSAPLRLLAIGIFTLGSAFAEDISATTGQLLDWETAEAWGGKDPASAKDSTFVIGRGAQIGPQALAQMVYVNSVWKGGNVRLDPGGELILTRPIRFPEGTKLILNGGQIVTKENRPVVITGDVEVTAESQLSYQGDNIVEFRGSITGGATFAFDRPSGTPRMIDFQGDLSKFTGTFHFAGPLIIRFRNGDWGTGTVTFEGERSKNSLLLAENGFKTLGKLDISGAKLDFQNTENSFGSLTVNGMSIDNGTYTEFTALIPEGNVTTVGRYLLNTENASVKVGP